MPNIVGLFKVVRHDSKKRNRLVELLAANEEIKRARAAFKDDHEATNPIKKPIATFAHICFSFKFIYHLCQDAVVDAVDDEEEDDAEEFQ